jgi:hypothetical protein
MNILISLAYGALVQGKSKNADLSGFGKRKSSDSNGGGSGGSNGDGKRVAKKEAGRLAAMEVTITALTASMLF